MFIYILLYMFSSKGASSHGVLIDDEYFDIWIEI